MKKYSVRSALRALTTFDRSDAVVVVVVAVLTLMVLVSHDLLNR